MEWNNSMVFFNMSVHVIIKNIIYEVINDDKISNITICINYLPTIKKYEFK